MTALDLVFQALAALAVFSIFVVLICAAFMWWQEERAEQAWEDQAREIRELPEIGMEVWR